MVANALGPASVTIFGICISDHYHINLSSDSGLNGKGSLTGNIDDEV